ncbi:hypothetical protein PR003_g1114 [Phytophthora rubi]|uniref:Uncharacterized protein n=1 Tax=Phytophthora rubi TaxID=129364 RepID=A0A6A4G7L3_9STRA|nr:hypothetical protein PR003_g1114 [Phytophthora rubi]
MNSLRKAAAAVTTAATALTRRCSGPAACKNDESSCGEEGPFPADSPQAAPRKGQWAAPRKGQWVAACKRSALPFSNGASDPKVSVGQPQATAESVPRERHSETAWDWSKGGSTRLAENPLARRPLAEKITPEFSPAPSHE